MPWSLPLTRPVVAVGHHEPLLTVGEAIAYLHHHFAETRNPARLNEVLVALALAAMSDRSIKIGHATDLLEEFLSPKPLPMAA